MSIIAINRSGTHSKEYVQIGDEFAYYSVIDPRVEVRKATGRTVHGALSIMSMVTGMIATGHTVIMEYEWTGEPRRYVRCTMLPFPVPVYYIFGAAWFRGNEWNDLCKSLQQHVVPASRLTVLEATAAQYMRFPFGPIKLVVP